MVSKAAIVIGIGFTLFAPPASDSRKLAIASLVLVSGSGLLELVSWAVVWISLFTSFPTLGWVMINLGFWLPEIGIAIYALALKKIAEYTRQGDAANESGAAAMHLFLLIRIQTVASIVLHFMLVSSIREPDETALGAVGLLGFLVGLGMFCAFAQWFWRFFQFLESLKFRKRRRSSGTSGNAWGQRR
ncbi:MAG: hypothetical protein VX768_18365 [Planctomycetota bacterium]|nr:hypothetical protein [Planctomycetota bacterium]